MNSCIARPAPESFTGPIADRNLRRPLLPCARHQAGPILFRRATARAWEEGGDDGRGGGIGPLSIWSTPMSLPTIIQAAVGQSLVHKVSRLFNGSLSDVLTSYFRTHAAPPRPMSISAPMILPAIRHLSFATTVRGSTILSNS